MQSIHGRGSNIAQKADVYDFNSEPRVLPGSQLTILIRDSNYTSLYGIFGALKYLEIPFMALSVHKVQNSLREVTAIFTDSDQFRNAINVFGNELTMKCCRLSGKAPLLISKSLGMMKRGYIWIATTWLSTILDSIGIPPKNAKTLHGVLTLCPHTPDSYRKKSFRKTMEEFGRLRIGVPLRAGFKEIIMQVSGTKQVAGFSIDVFLAAIKLLPYPLTYEFIMFGNGHNNPRYSDLVNKELDATVGDILIVSNHTKTVDFTHPYIKSGLVVVINIHKAHSSLWVYLQPFSSSLWATPLFFFFVGAVVWLLEQWHNDKFRGPPRKQVGIVLWFTFSMLFFSHILIVNLSYTTSLTSILTVQQLQTPITEIESLITSNELIGFQVGTYTKTYLVEELNIPRSRLMSLASYDEFAEKFLSRIVVAIVDRRPYVNLFL
ncbi:glutamate receptor 3.2-like protein [Tanacetum coccineum]|uniref:Glutamate receptor 3.2-like protein n=1 Tax=Tanacetum coccineum TaxID=301880 RepID=A0ABQ5GM56_9ASTR